MPNLGDFLGYIISEVTIARMQADLEAVRLAMEYRGPTATQGELPAAGGQPIRPAAGPTPQPPVARPEATNSDGDLATRQKLLKAMPVPRFRLPNLEITVPVGLSEMEEPAQSLLPRDLQLQPEQGGQAFLDLLSKDLAAAEITLPPEQLERIKQAVKARVSVLSSAGKPLPPQEIANALSEVADKQLAAIKILGADQPKLKAVADQIKKSSQLVLRAIAQPPRLKVRILTSELADKPKESLAYLKLTLTEEAYEWTSIPKPDGTLEDRLVRE